MSIPSLAAAPDSPWWLPAPAAGIEARAPLKDEAVAEVTGPEVEQAVRALNVSLADRTIGIQFELDPTTEKMIVRVVDNESGEVIRQIPNEEVVRMARIMAKAPGMLVSNAA